MRSVYELVSWNESSINQNMDQLYGTIHIVASEHETKLQVNFIISFSVDKIMSQSC
jgi:hypothetical protein